MFSRKDNSFSVSPHFLKTSTVIQTHKVSRWSLFTRGRASTQWVLERDERKVFSVDLFTILGAGQNCSSVGPLPAASSSSMTPSRIIQKKKCPQRWNHLYSRTSLQILWKWVNGWWKWGGEGELFPMSIFVLRTECLEKYHRPYRLKLCKFSFTWFRHSEWNAD